MNAAANWSAAISCAVPSAKRHPGRKLSYPDPRESHFDASLKARKLCLAARPLTPDAMTADLGSGALWADIASYTGPAWLRPLVPRSPDSCQRLRPTPIRPPVPSFIHGGETPHHLLRW